MTIWSAVPTRQGLPGPDLRHHRSRYRSEGDQAGVGDPGTPPNSCGRGCGGRSSSRAHKGFWSEESGYYYTASGEPGLRNTLLHVSQIKDPTTPKFVGRAWLPGMKNYRGQGALSGAIRPPLTIDEANNRMYIGFRDTSGQIQYWDISDPANPKLVWSSDAKSPNRGPHTLTPIVYDQLPNFHGNAYSADVHLHDGRGGWRRRQRAVRERCACPGVHVRPHARDPSDAGVPVGGARRRFSARKVGALGRTSTQSS